MSNPPNSRPAITETGTAAAMSCDVRLADGDVWALAEEVPVAIVYNRRNHAVMLATPADLTDFAIGFSLSEGIIRDPSEIEAVEIVHQTIGVNLHITLNPERLERFDLVSRRRNLPGRAGCGLCGLENVESLTAPLEPVVDTHIEPNPEALARALDELSHWQPLNVTTRSVHAAAWADLSGQIIAAREDVGRHNALDKLIGANAVTGRAPADGFLIMSSRCSYELVEKAARAGLPAIASLSAPTAFAVRKATEARISLYARKGNAFVRVT
ncbi:formate dehydrogenase accessory sulfurtransferase FdhD [Maricaulis sp.]|uniref:formate dehydrogenase accessory sulfurtransferase FdhD n=1 Tax=Maricaulis sp. TaxID=1486257 RepID=UPI0025BD921B|nr:formate dehydrogenase accessory sulfurtransferase FdhD [Maricaulis sp.]